jgi:hypothetical protein
MSLGALGNLLGIFLVLGGCAGWFLRGFEVPGARGGVVWGDKTKMRHFSGILGCVGSEHP